MYILVGLLLIRYFQIPFLFIRALILSTRAQNVNHVTCDFNVACTKEKLDEPENGPLQMLTTYENV